MILPIHTPGYTTKRHTTKQTRYTFHRNKVLCRHFPYPTSRKSQEQHKLLMPHTLTQTPQNPSHHPARSNRHHLPQPHKKPAPEPWRYWSTCHDTRKNAELTCNYPQQKTNQTRHSTHPQKYLSNYPGGVQASASQPPDPHRQGLLIL